MKRILTLLLVPALLLSSCGGKKVDYSTFSKTARDADSEALKVTIDKKTIDVKGSTKVDEDKYTFTIHEEYNLESNELKLDNKTAKYECNNGLVLLSVSFALGFVSSMKASSVGEKADCVYTVSPLSVTEKENYYEFDKYGNLVKYKVSSDTDDYTITQSYSYKNI